MLFNTNDVISKSSIAFGTSGARGLVVDFTPDVCAAFTVSFLSLVNKTTKQKKIALAIDNRPSSYHIAQWCAAALAQFEVEPIFYGVIPTPALANQAMLDNMPAIMVTGSHIPFDRNGLKFYLPTGEISKNDELYISNASVDFKRSTILPSLVINSSAADNYVFRYTSLYPDDVLKGIKIGIYEHSSAGRELYGVIFSRLGADVIALERSDQFVPIDTEAVSEADKIKARSWSRDHHFDAIFSTDGDGDRPLLADEHGEWLRGDVLGILAAKLLKIEAVATPISSNTIVNTDGFFKKVVNTKIGSPYVIDSMNGLIEIYNAVAGFEANGGFLLASDLVINGNLLSSLPTRDALLPVIAILTNSQRKKVSDMVKSLPARYTYSDRIKNIPEEKSLHILDLALNNPAFFLGYLKKESISVSHIDKTDGIRISLSNNDVIHLRKSGNAPELRCYSESHSPEKAKSIVEDVLTGCNSLECV